MTGKIREQLEEILTTENIFYEEPMAQHTSFRIGGRQMLLSLRKARRRSAGSWQYAGRQGLPSLFLATAAICWSATGDTGES